MGGKYGQEFFFVFLGRYENQNQTTLTLRKTRLEGSRLVMFNRTEDWCEVVTTPGYSSFCKCFSSYKCKYLSLFKPTYQYEDVCLYTTIYTSSYPEHQGGGNVDVKVVDGSSPVGPSFDVPTTPSLSLIIRCTYYTEFITNHLMYLRPDHS